ncbi:E3 ubiquitin-protein ligase HERC1-like [Oopsacas minuta]|uniref:E3 ubiquitin-protein ligase HERC1-like n=1 Tax=Oopsacas minuta TaxID=111878 RepID=A0AAV7KDX1_9METZ|nr:E3 ubiquitin-protein ligase HERC1-like [Oopsacas minuta]
MSVKDQSKKQGKSSQKTVAPFEPTKQQIDTSNVQNDKDSPLDSIAVYFQSKDPLKHFETQIKSPTLSSKIISTITEFLLEPIRAYKAKHQTEVQKSGVLAEPIELQSKWNENLLENIAKTMAVQKKRAELRYEAIKLIQCVLLSRGNKPLGQISSILPTAYRLLQTSLLGNTGLQNFNKRNFVIMGNISSAPRDLQLKIKSAFNKILTYVFKKIAQAAKACTKAVEKEKVPLYLDLVINMSWLQGKVNCFDVNEVCSPHILSVLAELSGIISTKLPFPFPEDNKLERCIRNIAAMLFYYIAAIIGYNSSELNHTVLESVVGLLYGELEGQFIPHKPKIIVKPYTDEYTKQRQKDVDYDSKNDLQVQSPIDFLELSLPFEFNHPVHPETLKQLEKLWCTISNDDREYSMGSYINYLSRVASTDKMRSHFANTAWVGLLLRIAGTDPEYCLPRCISIRTRISALNLLSNILTEHPKEKNAEKGKIIDVLFNQMSLCQFAQPVFHITKGDTPATSTQSDTHKYIFENICANNSCKIEGDNIKKTAIGDTYLFMNYQLDTGNYLWKIKLTNSDSANNSVFIGVACKPLQDTDIKSTQSCWTVDTFSGSLFHDGQLPELFSPCVTGDTIRCHFDSATKKLYLAKNSDPLEEVFQHITLTNLFPFISFNNKSVTSSVEFLGFETCSEMTVPHRHTLDLIRSELSHSYTPTPLLDERLSIGEGFTRLIRKLMHVECWRNPIQKCCNERLKLMDHVVQSLVHRNITGHIEVHRLCFQIWPVLSLLANTAPVFTVGGSVYHTEDDIFDAISLTEYKQPLVYYQTGTKSQIPVSLPTDKVEPVPLPKLAGFDWEQIGPTTLLNLAHLSGLWDDEEMNVLTAGAPFLSRGYAKHLLDGQVYREDNSTIPISVTASLEWRQFLMWQIQTMALRTLQAVLMQDRFLHLLIYHPISINQDTVIEDQGDIAHAVQQIMRHLVSRSTSPAPLSPAVSIGCLESVQRSLTSHGMLKLYLDCADAIIGSDKANETELAIAAIPNPPPDLPLIYHPPNAPPPLPPKTKRPSPRPVTPVQTRPQSPPPAYTESLLEMGFTNQQVNRARRKLKPSSNESIENQTSTMVMWLLEHANEDDSGGETGTPPPLPPRDEPLLFPLTLEQTLAQSGGSYPPRQYSTPATDPIVLATDIPPKSESDKVLEGLFPDFSRTDFSSPKNQGTQNEKKDLLSGPDPTSFIRDIYRNIPDIAGELLENCKRLLLHSNQVILSSQSELKQVLFSSEDCLGADAIKSNQITQEKENVFLQTDTRLQNKCSHLSTLDEYINAVERITNSIKTQIARQLILHAFSSLSLKPDDFMFGIVNLGTQDLNVLLRLLRLSYTHRFGSYNSELDDSVCISSAIKQVLSRDPESLARTLQICTRDIMATAVKATHTPESYFLDTHTNISDSTVFATIHFPVTKLLVEIVIDVYNSTDNRSNGTAEATLYSMENLVNALSACEFSKNLSSEDKQWSTEQLVKLLVTSKGRRQHSTIEPEVIIVDAMMESRGHDKQVMNSVWCEKTAQLLSISKDNTIKIWKNKVGTEELTVSSTLQFTSNELDEISLQPADNQEAPKPIPSTVLPYIAIDQTGEYIAASRDYTLNVWYTGYVNNNKINAIKELGKLITYTSYIPADMSTTTKIQSIEYIPSLLIGCIDGSILSADIKLDRTGDGKLNLEVKELDNMMLPDNGAVVKMIFDESGHTLALGSSKGSVTIFTQINTNGEYERIKTLVLHESVIQILQFNPSGTLLATLAEGEAVKGRIWRPERRVNVCGQVDRWAGKLVNRWIDEIDWF